MTEQTVLIVEDDKNLGQALSDTLELAGMQTIHVTDGQAALNIINNQDIALIVSDVQMKPMDGFTLLENIRKRFASIQAEDELAAIGMVIGAAWNGARAFTSAPSCLKVTQFGGRAWGYAK